ncbi:MAG: S8 family serine peptidase, partial [Candidatus Latescibacteria bacterium]|nr:S8 family serine peptidase [Candidatus Latescibacterota bacterium]
MNIAAIRRPLAFFALFASILIGAPGTAADAAPIDLNGIRFDPSIEEPSIPPELRAPETRGPALYLVQLTGPIEEAWKEQIRRHGGELFGYVPQNAFVVRVDPQERRSVAALPFVGWIGPYHLAYRISPAIGTTAFRDPARAEDPRVTLRVRVTDAPDRTARAAGRIGEVVERIDDRIAPGFVVRVAPDRVRAVAALATVLYVEELPECFLLNNTTRWVVQSNQTGQTPIWSQGIRGDGQLLCMMDSGLDYNSCWFRENGNAPPGPTHRKVVDYREWGGGNAYDGCSSGHGTHVAGTAVGDQSYINGGNYSYNGMADRARIMVQDVGGDSWLACLFGLISPPSSLTSPFDDAYTNGARVHTNSWGSSSNSYDGYAVDIDGFMWSHPDFLVFFANGNAGPGGGTVGSPATAK